MLSQKRIFILTATAALFSLCATPLTAAGEGPMNWASDLASAQAEAVKTGKLLLIHFSGERCAPCVRVERNVFGQANVCHQIGTRFVPVHINATAQPNIARQFQVSSWPTDLVLTANGQELHRMTSPQDPRAYLAELGKSVWRAQSLGANAPAPTAVAQAPVARQAAASQPVARQPQQPLGIQQQTHAAQPQQLPARAQQRVPQPTQPSAMQAAIAQGGGMFPQQSERLQQAASAGYANAGYQVPPALPPRSAQPNPMPTSSVQELAAAQLQSPTNQSVNVPGSTGVANAAAALTAAAPTNISAASAAVTLPRSQANTVGQQATNASRQVQQNPAKTTADLYPQTQQQAVPPQLRLQTHNAPVASQPASRIAANATPGGVQRTSYDQGTEVDLALPPGQNPFGATQPNPNGSVMLSNPFLTRKTQAAPQPQPAYQAPPVTPIPQNHVAPPAAQTTREQPVVTPAPIRTASIAPAQTPTPALTPAMPEPQAPAANTDLPENVAMDGFCCVTLHEEERWVKGNAAWGAQHRGMVYLFDSAATQQRFLADPDKFSPLLSGYDPVVYHQTGELKSGFRALGVRYKEMTCLFSSEESLQRFWESPWQYAQTAQQAMRSDTTLR